ncbi:ADP-ribosylglycohydrolase family protein [Natronomonas gomsonensis]|uniref:ADP-ribosylglycohydrolase family protein n=1 Tax=Natronomonas gomsonensis TaxID=1046043 RepID=UPI001C4CE7B8|nr:ADP-ribosylglycohydrolase family protein [Natronomonas gomsonensis]
MDLDRARGVLLGLACGDALGWPVEFASTSAISAEHGRLNFDDLMYDIWQEYLA